MGGAHGRFVISLDFELHWGVRDIWSVDEYRANLEGVREVVPRLLDLFALRGIHATWATVGFLMADSREQLLDHLPAVRPAYRDRRLDPYAELPALGEDERDDPFHYAPSLLRLIASAPGQEVATHTFSHFYPLEPGASAEAFSADLDAALSLAGACGLSLTSIVFPRNQLSSEALRIGAGRGLTAFRGTEQVWYQRARSGAPPPLARPIRLLDAYVPLGRHHLQLPHEVDGLVNVPASRFLRACRGSPGLLDTLRVARVEQAMSAAASQGTIFHLWWHPHGFGADPDENLAVLERILDYYDRLRDSLGMRSMTICEVAEEYGLRSAPTVAPPDRARRP
jgi:peptidoglycan/xylan/chitin deacetylase (PgdA/CDA1 family)